MTSRRQRPTDRVRAQAVLGLAALPLLLSTASLGAADGTVVPATPGELDAPAAAADALRTGAGVTATPASVVLPRRISLGDVDAGDIPWTAVQAYHRSADILGHVQPSCELSWTLLAAIGKVASDHGRAGASDLADDGVANPALVGPALDGRGGRAKVADTDGGDLDGDGRWDHPVGPMQIRPAAWALAGVDGDGDGTRSPDDLDDAALAAAVYLCASDDGGLADPAAAADALRAYGGSDRWVAQVLAVQQAYAEGSFEVGAPPTISSIGATLDTGSGVRAASARAVERVSAVHHDAALRSSDEPTHLSRPGAAADEPPSAPGEAPPAALAGEALPDEPLPDEPAADTVGPADPADPNQPADPGGPSAPEEPADPGAPPADEPPADEPPADEPGSGGEPVPAEETCSLPDPEQGGEPATDPATDPGGETGSDPEAETPTGTTPYAVTESPAETPGSPPADGSTDPTSGATLAVMTGTLRLDGETFCLDALPVDASSVADQVELVLTLVGTTVEVTVVEGTEPLVVVEVDGVPTQPATTP